MLRLKSKALPVVSLFALVSPALVCPALVCFSRALAAAQAGNAGTVQSPPPAPTAKPSTDQIPAPEAAPIPAHAPHMARQTRFEIIRDFEAQLVYARASFPMGTKGLQLKQGVLTPNGEEM